MAAGGPNHRANDGTFIHPGRDLGEAFANLDARDIGRNRLEFASNLGRGVGFQVEHVLVGRATA